jgi:hypothetical protein
MVEPFEISPNEIFFRKIQVDNTYEIVVLVKNLTKKAKRIRVFQPKSHRFRCDYDIKGPIAAGLTVKMIVRYYLIFTFLSISNIIFYNFYFFNPKNRSFNISKIYKNFYI